MIGNPDFEVGNQQNSYLLTIYYCIWSRGEEEETHSSAESATWIARAIPALGSTFASLIHKQDPKTSTTQMPVIGIAL
jgi:hypothetical protein